MDLDWLMGTTNDGKANTLYLAAPDTEFQRLAPVLGGLLGDLREQVHSWDIEGRRLPKPLLIVIDEAGQLELSWLPAEVSTIAGLGAMLVTCWQSKAQVTDRYGNLADAVLSGHRSKVFFSGIDDPATVDYLSKVAGTEHVAQRSWNAEVHGPHRSVSEHPQREDLLPVHVARQLSPHDAVLVHGTLPPVHLRLVRWWADRELRRLVPTDTRGRPTPPEGLATCPLGDQPAEAAGPTLDLAVLDDPAARLPGGEPRQPAGPPARKRPAKAKPTPPRTAGNGGDRAAPGPGERDDATVVPFLPPHDSNGEGGGDGGEPEVREVNRVAGVCERCSRWVPVGEGSVTRSGRRQWVRCHPACPRPGGSPAG